jgi:hypothetical protein
MQMMSRNFLLFFIVMLWNLLIFVRGNGRVFLEWIFRNLKRIFGKNIWGILGIL